MLSGRFLNFYRKGKPMSLFLPDSIFRRITDIDTDALKAAGVEALLLDIDNTLSTHHGTVLVDGLEDWLLSAKTAGISMIIVSNSKKFRVEPFSKRLGLPFISTAMKPLPFGYLKAIRKMGADKRHTAIIGDQIFTDVLGARLCGVRPLLVRPIKEETGWSFRIRRHFERRILKNDY